VTDAGDTYGVDVTSSASVAYKLFGALGVADGTTIVRNDLPDGRLPDNRYGSVVGCAIDFFIPNWTITEAVAYADPRCVLGALQFGEFELLRNRTQFKRGPIWMCPKPPFWIQGQQIGATTQNVSPAIVVQNGGYLIEDVETGFAARDVFTGTVQIPKVQMSGVIYLATTLITRDTRPA
jgi:hypothetical protein